MTADEKLDALIKAMDLSLRWQAAHDEQHAFIARDLNDIRHDLYGNGTPGLKARTQTIEQRCAANVCSRFWDFATKVAVNVLSGGSLIFFGWLLMIYKIH